MTSNKALIQCKMQSLADMTSLLYDFAEHEVKRSDNDLPAHANVELEARLGVLQADGSFKTGVQREYFIELLTLVRTAGKYNAKKSDYNPHTNRDEWHHQRVQYFRNSLRHIHEIECWNGTATSEDYFESATRLYKLDFENTQPGNELYNVRIASKVEVPISVDEAIQKYKVILGKTKPQQIRHRCRQTFTYSSLGFRMEFTVTSLNDKPIVRESVDVNNATLEMALCKDYQYEIELELLNSSEVDRETAILSFAQQSVRLLGQSDTPVMHMKRKLNGGV